MRLSAVVVVAFVGGCATLSVDMLTPAICRAYGVGVPPRAVPTGVVVAEHFGTFAHMAHACAADDRVLYGGCTLARGGNRYEVWYADSRCIRTHELCHARYEVPHHTADYLARAGSGDWLAACPEGG